MPRLLVVDDEPSVCYSFRRVFSRPGVEVLTAATARAGLEKVREAAPDVVVLDLQLPDRDGLALFDEIQQQFPRLPVVFVTAHGTAETALEAMKRGAFDYLVKPVDFDQVSQVIGRAFDAARLMQMPSSLPPEGDDDRIVGRSPVIQEVCKQIGRVAAQDVNVLIVGESGTGKELAARALYQHSKRADRPFLAVNCAALPEGLVESELFGHEKGAFTGAERRRVGKFEQCDGGTLFLDEIGDMSPAVQAKILRVLQDQRFERVGGHETVQTQARVIAATNRDLETLVAEGRFRADLYYRLRTFTLYMPPLRERREDIPELAHHFLFKFNRELGLDLRGFSPEALDLLQRHDWPGNVRELQAAVKQAMLQATGTMILPEFLSILPSARSRSETTRQPSAEVLEVELPGVVALLEGLLARGEGELYTKIVQAVERVVFTRVLRHTHGHQARASEILGINRSTLRQKLRDLGLSLDKVVTENPQTD